ncbi:MAG: EAL domain-containing protein [Immundisolibacteraceae bacterium]|nr:EAL domain-containing protein [Immundisolibacteraceae bacterium]
MTDEVQLADPILLVEDNPDDAELTRILLKKAGIRVPVINAESIKAALKALDSTEPDYRPPSMIFLDLGLPDAVDLDGLTSVVAAAPNIPIVMLTGLADQRQAMRAIENGAQDYLTKGEFSPELLQRVHRYAIERKRAEGDLLKAARFDIVTGLTNRAYFFSLLEHSLERARRNGQQLAVLFMDLDHFKNVNDTLGHSAGDQLLCEVGKRLQSCVRTIDLVARIGGEEFTMLVEDLSNGTDASNVADKVLAALRKPFWLDGIEVMVTPSIGIATFPEAGNEAMVLLRNADTAMYRAKMRGRNTVEFFTEKMNAEMNESSELEAALEQALANDEFEVLYEPVVNLPEHRIIAIDALPRWLPKPGQQEILQSKFLPVLERTGRIHEFGEWLLTRACRDCRRWQENSDSELVVTVNVSALQLATMGFVERVKRVLADTDLAADKLEVEVVEAVTVDVRPIVLQTMIDLRSLGVSVCLDGFGAGSAALGRLSEFPFNRVKIDPKLITQVPSNQDRTWVLSGLLLLAKGLGWEVVAQGVSNDAQLAFLMQQGCQRFQGELFGGPVAVEELSSPLMVAIKPNQQQAIR